jgi:rhodanese-related sulfurtransferase
MIRLVCVICTLIGWSCGSQAQSVSPKCHNPLFNSLVKNMIDQSIPTLDVDELSANQKQYYILDAREWSEYKVSHIPGATHIGYDNFNAILLDRIDKHQPIAIYCSIGYRSEKIGEKLVAMGFQEVYNVYGSIFEWANRGYPLVDIKGQTTRRVHGYDKKWGIWINRKKADIVYE